MNSENPEDPSRATDFGLLETQSYKGSSRISSRTIGPYKLLQKIGEGGMGSVWMAEQERPVRRRVALKLIKAGSDNEQIIARFDAERQALAMMDHVNIAKVLDAGTEEGGSPYFVMELVQGIPFTEYCDQNRLSIAQRLELFIPVCQAIQHAHQKGIVHRDIKPSNVLVCLYDGKPMPKVIDFGLAKALQYQTRLTDKSVFTEFGQLIGTLQYMSPEQAEMNHLDIDTRTDIYSLGVMLYELLTGSTPLDLDSDKQQSILQSLETIRSEETSRPSLRLSSLSQEAARGISELRCIDVGNLRSLLRGELDWIVMKALEKDRTRRYASANEFGKDIASYLAGEVVSARPPSLWYRTSKWWARWYAEIIVSTVSLIIAWLISIVFRLPWLIGLAVFLSKMKVKVNLPRLPKRLDRVIEQVAENAGMLVFAVVCTLMIGLILGFSKLLRVCVAALKKNKNLLEQERTNKLEES